MSSPEIRSFYYQRAPHVLAAATILPFFDIVAVGLRILARKRQKQRLQADDWLTIPALILTLGAAASLISGVALHANGYPVPTPDSPELATRSDLSLVNDPIIIASKVEWANFLMLIPALGCTKMSFLCFYYRIFCSHKMSHVRWFLFSMMAIVFSWTVGFWFSQLFTCGTHFFAIWGSVQDLMKYCVKTMKKQYVLAISSFVVDAIILVIPLPLVWRLQLQPKRKVAVSFVFLLGFGAVTASAIRLALVDRVVRIGFDPRDDEILVITGMQYWLLVEQCLGLIAACMPTIRFFFKGFSPESVINSVRSALSLHSLRSDSSPLNESNDARTSNRNVTGSDRNVTGSDRNATGSDRNV